KPPQQAADGCAQHHRPVHQAHGRAQYHQLMLRRLSHDGLAYGVGERGSPPARAAAGPGRLREGGSPRWRESAEIRGLKTWRTTNSAPLSLQTVAARRRASSALGPPRTGTSTLRIGAVSGLTSATSHGGSTRMSSTALTQSPSWRAPWPELASSTSRLVSVSSTASRMPWAATWAIRTC